MAYYHPLAKLIPESSGPGKWSHPGFPHRTFGTLSLILKLNIAGVGDMRGMKAQTTRLPHSYFVSNCIFLSTINHLKFLRHSRPG